MGRWVAVWMLAWMSVAQAEGIVEVLDRSQAQRLAQLADPQRGAPPAEAVQRIQASFARLTDQLKIDRPVSLQVVRGEALAETLQGRVVVVDAALADLPEGQRLFVLAHELGHVALGHWGAMGSLYQRHIPDEVLRSKTDAVAVLLGREASALAHDHEYSADAYGLKALIRLGYGQQDIDGLFARFGPSRDTPTHPGTRRRLARLQSTDLVAMQE
jgi:predicted Zn-dependent protease